MDPTLLSSAEKLAPDVVRSVHDFPGFVVQTAQDEGETIGPFSATTFAPFQKLPGLAVVSWKPCFRRTFLTFVTEKLIIFKYFGEEKKLITFL